MLARVKDTLRTTPLYDVSRRAYRAAFRREEYKDFRRTRALYSGFVRRGDLCFDVGANYGSRTDAMLSLGARVVAVEPQSTIAATLKRRFAHRAPLVVIGCALGAKPGSAPMYVSDNHVLSSLSRDWVALSRAAPHLRGATWAETTVPVSTLDALIKEHGRPAFIKIDVEGFDAEVLRGLSTPVPVLCFEATPYASQRAADCLLEIARLGQAQFNLVRGESHRMSFDRWLTAGEIESFVRDELPKEATYGDIYARFS